MPSLCRERKPEEKATQKYSPFNSQPSWNHIQQLASHAGLSRALSWEERVTSLRTVCVGGYRTTRVRDKFAPACFFQGVLPIRPFDFYRTNSTFPTALPSPCVGPNPEQKAAREEEIPKVNGKHRKLKLDICNVT